MKSEHEFINDCIQYAILWEESLIESISAATNSGAREQIKRSERFVRRAKSILAKRHAKSILDKRFKQ